MEYELVNGLGPVDDVVDQWFPDEVAVGAFGLAGYGHADTTHLAFMHVVGPEEKVVLPSFLHHSGGPHRPPCPPHFRRIQNPFMFGPSDQVGRRKTIKMNLLLIGIGIGGIDPVAVPVYHRLGIGVPPLNDRIP